MTHGKDRLITNAKNFQKPPLMAVINDAELFHLSF